MNDLVRIEIPSMQMDEAELLSVMQSSVYPGAKLESIKLAIGYCKAQALDPMMKPVHIVPMDIPTGKKDADGWDITEKRDTVMPGIGLYRIQASRTKEHAGTSEPEFGEDVTQKLGETTITYPKWCKVTVKRIVQGRERDYVGKELWIENYATKGKNKADPNKMWKKRPYAQLAKCAEAQALRRAFPEVGQQPTAEEMEGKSLADDDSVIDGQAIRQPAIEGPKSKTESANPPAAEASPPSSSSEASAPAGGAAESATEEGKPLTEGAKSTLRKAMERAGRTEADLTSNGFSKIDAMKFGKFNEAMKWVKEHPAAT